MEIESKVPVTGVCIDLAPGLMSDVWQTLLMPEALTPDLSAATFFDSGEFFESKFSAANTALGSTLVQLDQLLSLNPYEQHHFDSAFYFRIAEQIIADYNPLVKQLQRIPAVKSQTRKDLFRKLQAGHDYLLRHFSKVIDIPMVAAACGLSEYYFFRLFRTVYGQSPMQFVIQLRLEYAVTLLKQHHCTVTEAAVRSGFSDIYSFSKAFRKKFGISPGKIADRHAPYH